MNRYFKFGITILMASMLLQGCTKNFVDINTNPNTTSTAAPQSLIGPALMRVLTTNLTRNARINNELMQVTVTTNDNLENHRYQIRPSESDGPWSTWYTELTNIRDIYIKAEQSQQKGFETYQGISLVLDAWISSLITDMYGDVPYFESNKGYSESNLSPYFDKQEDIYRDLFLKLEKANALLKKNVSPDENDLAFDPIYNSSPEKWRKFGNSLYLRLLLRVSHIPQSNAAAKIKEILETNSGEYPIMASNDDSAILYFTNTQPYLNPYYNDRAIDFNGNRGYAEFFVNNLLALNDPRLKIWATEATLGVYGGMQSGYNRGATPEPQSRPIVSLKTDARLGNILNYAELQFIVAECAVRSFVGLDAEAFYLKGISSSMDLWKATMPTDYLTNTKVAFQSTDTTMDKIKKIQLQRYYALFFTDFQQWYEYRRTKALDLYRGPAMENNGKMPIRLNYPIVVQSMNRKNYIDAVARIGKDDINAKMWWQTLID